MDTRTDMVTAAENGYARALDAQIARGEDATEEHAQIVSNVFSSLTPLDISDELCSDAMAAAVQTRCPELVGEVAMFLLRRLAVRCADRAVYGESPDSDDEAAAMAMVVAFKGAQQ